MRSRLEHDPGADQRERLERARAPELAPAPTTARSSRRAVPHPGAAVDDREVEHAARADAGAGADRAAGDAGARADDRAGADEHGRDELGVGVDLGAGSSAIGSPASRSETGVRSWPASSASWAAR